MQLFELHDDPNNYCNADERIWAAIWAESEEEAIRYFNQHCDINRTWKDKDEEGTHCKMIPDLGCHPEHPGTHEEQRPRVLRKLGWKQDGEHSCNTCGLFAFGMEEYRVCDECSQCPECMGLGYYESDDGWNARDGCGRCKGTGWIKLRGPHAVGCWVTSLILGDE